MKALGKLKKEVGIWMYDAPMPEIGPNDLLVKIKKTAICGTDIHIYNWDEWSQRTIPVPMTTGHEFIGIVEKVGSAVEGYKVGDRVSGEGHVVCGHCRNCRAGKRHLCRNTKGIGVNRTGAFAEYLSLPASNAVLIPENVSDDEAAIMDPLGNAVHTALSFDLVGEDVLITGAGPIGIMGAMIAKHVGARKVVLTEINADRLALAKKVCKDVTIVNPKEESLGDVMKRLGMTEGFDVGLEMSGSPVAFNQMISAMNNGGRIALLGILPAQAGVDWGQVIFKGLFIKGIYGREMFETWYKMISMLQSGLDVKPIITHHFKVDDYKEAFELMRSGKSGKVILDWT
ncbi:MAG: L-threonine 3-dehydrogenase [Pseudomonadota bacterium]|nr:L-threonine 3-dehydrogenase [Gammaproteobacteria bacterium]MBU1559195.1 L-threonine 3-dehydrogenase [Gammaproteobacteria bacterium]MBU1628685.1 L-threonine 3-dehydrogenase [Gammaproteobacteria bacterium]MBU1927214.1 L-threonine 3-dehydrogenase [Gammaproteobacteria bacterium]MBU2546673.1 L-threonine 3-dehydrogenase [Gammaproteobacteria bacterium]